jgi:polyisoprenoid-binding protein YceI
MMLQRFIVLSHSACLSALMALPCLAAPILAHAASAEYRLDPVHTRVMFAIEHAGFSRAIGTVSGSTGTLVFDSDDWKAARLEVSVPLARLDMGDQDWNRAVAKSSLLNVNDFPTATFVSTHIEPIDAQHASVYGSLTLRGVTREVKLDVTLNAVKRHPMPPFRRTAGFSATTRISRADFGITAWKNVIGDDVELRVEAEAIRAGRANGGDTETGDPANVPETVEPLIPPVLVPEPTP